MKIIFLDHDGVMSTLNELLEPDNKYEQWRLKHSVVYYSDKYIPYWVRFKNFNTECVKALNEILLTTDAEIVVSSGWRHYATLSEMSDWYTNQGVLKPPIGYTPDILPSVADNPFQYEGQRVKEIMALLNTGFPIEKWVAVDDLNLQLGNSKLPNFVQTDIDSGIANPLIIKNILNYLI